MGFPCLAVFRPGEYQPVLDVVAIDIRRQNPVPTRVFRDMQGDNMVLESYLGGLFLVAEVPRHADVFPQVHKHNIAAPVLIDVRSLGCKIHNRRASIVGALFVAHAPLAVDRCPDVVVFLLHHYVIQSIGIQVGKQGVSLR